MCVWGHGLPHSRLAASDWPLNVCLGRLDLLTLDSPPPSVMASGSRVLRDGVAVKAVLRWLTRLQRDQDCSEVDVAVEMAGVTEVFQDHVLQVCVSAFLTLDPRTSVSQQSDLLVLDSLEWLGGLRL
jgi:hypothetical protein